MESIKFRDLRSNEIECRVGNVKDGKGFSLLLYKTARADMQVLDETLGAYNWQCKYYQVKNTMLCTISIWDNEKKQWIEKCDGGDDDFNAEKVKGECSDAFKRASFRVGIGRKLYESPFIWISESSDNNKYSKYEVTEIAYNETSVVKLVIINSKTKQVVFSYGVCSKSASNEPKATKEQGLDNKQNVSMKEISATVTDMGVNTELESVKEYLHTLSQDEQDKFSAWLFNAYGETDVNKLNEEKLARLVNTLRKANKIK